MSILESSVVQRSFSLCLVGLATIVCLGGCGTSAQTPSSSNTATIEASGEPLNPAEDPWQISETGVGPIEFGMTLEAVRSVLSPEMTLTPEPNLLVDWDGMALRENDTPLLYILYPAGTIVSDSSIVKLLMVVDPRYTTPEGIGPESTIAAAQEVYGQATLSYNTDDESREYVRFLQSPPNLGFRTTGSPGQWVGRYPESADGSYYETQDFDPDGTIAFVFVDGFVELSDATTEADPASVTDAPDAETSAPDNALDCEDPLTTLDINACSKAAHDAADRTLNEVYQQVQAKLDSRASDQLRGAEDAWLNFRDAHCSQYSQTFVGGTAYPSFLLGCLTRTTEERIGYLRQELGLFAEQDRTYPELGVLSVDGQSVDCRDPQATPVVNYCAQQSYKQSDRALNETYQTLSGQLSASSKAALTEAQLAWLEYRDRHCEFATREAVGGTGYEGYRSNCLEDLTRERTEELKIQLDR
ncbi:MAG: lysozyme inhibitor LprI family protein [Prochlorotrichaceae cyanobacterium]